MSCLAQVTFPGVGELVRNRAGRIEFVFEQQLVDALELGLAPVSSRTDGHLADAVLNNAQQPAAVPCCHHRQQLPAE